MWAKRCVYVNTRGSRREADSCIMKASVFILFLKILLFGFSPSTGYPQKTRIIFHHEDRKIFIPLNYPKGEPIYQAVAEAEDPKVKIVYCLKKPSKIFSVENTTGIVSLKKRLGNKNNKKEKLLQIYACPDTSLCSDSICTSMWPRIQFVSKNIQCSNPKDVCLLPGRTFHVLENRENVNLGSIAYIPAQKYCEHIPKHLTTDDPNLTIDGWQLKVRKAYDREVKEALFFNVSCTIPSSTQVITKKFKLVIEDEDDNPPILDSIQTKRLRAWQLGSQRYAVMVVNHIENYYEDDIFQPGQLTALTFSDSDLMNTNHYKITILKDHYRYFKQGDRSPHLFEDSKNNLTHTYGGIVLYANLPIRKKDLFDYDITLNITDTSYKPKDGKQTLLIDLKFRAPPSDLPDFELPKTYTKTISIDAPHYTRIFYLFTNVTSFSVSNLDFSVTPSKRNPFDVTPHEGIVYLADRELLENITNNEYTFFLNLKRGSKQDRCKITVILDVEDRLPECELYNEICAAHEHKHDCEMACGSGTPNGSCVWRQGPGGNKMTTQYSTCSTDFAFCPNGFCDELENDKWSLCPQDCDGDPLIVEPYWEKGSEERGILKGPGLCTCPRGRCSCDSENITEPKIDGPIKYVSPHSTSSTTTYVPPPLHATESSHPVVGELIVIILSGVAVILVISCVACAVWRNKKKPKPKCSTENLVDLSGYSFPRSVDSAMDPTDPVLLQIFPEDRKWEFPRVRLILEEVLGEGEFGRVVRAKAFGINGIQGFSTVAVKMLKSGAASQDNQDIITELNLLKEVDHPNVIKLLGACTTRGGPLYIIMEYCCHGSLRSFLRRGRHSETVRGTYDTPKKNLTARDILSFAWQISKGMAYLANLKLVHRDLAARNILLSDDHLCKISDFGLTRDVYEADTYTKKSRGRVPVKWMALESLVDNIYSTKSDVWSFGIVLYECVTLGQSPYPGVTPERLFKLLQEGYRMEQPSNCSEQLYIMMRKCWITNPDARPTFEEISVELEEMLSSHVDYVDMAAPSATNPTYFQNDDEVGTSDSSTGSDPNTTATSLNNTGGTTYDIPVRNAYKAPDKTESEAHDLQQLPLSFEPTKVRIIKNKPSIESDEVTTETAKLLPKNETKGLMYSVVSAGYEIPLTTIELSGEVTV